MSIPSVTQRLVSLAESFISFAEDNITIHPGEVIDLAPIFNMEFSNYAANTGLAPNPAKAVTYTVNAYIPDENAELLHNVANPRFYIDNKNKFHASKKPYDYPIGAEYVGFVVTAKTDYLNPSSADQDVLEVARVVQVYVTVDLT